LVSTKYFLIRKKKFRNAFHKLIFNYPYKILFATFASLASIISAALAFTIFQAQKFERNSSFSDLAESDINEYEDQRTEKPIPVRAQKDGKKFYHSLIALNVHQYLQEQVAFLDPSADLSFICRNKIMRIRNPSVINQIKKKRAFDILCV
jgi:hypothetical protein